MKKILFNILKYVIRKTYKIQPHTLLFVSKPDYSDNPKILSEYLRKQKKYDIYWLIRDKNTILPSEDKKYHFIMKSQTSLKDIWQWIKITCTAQYIFTSHGFPIPYKEKRNGQYFIELWHGCGYKNKDCNNERFFDYACVPGPLFVKTKMEFWSTTSEYILAKGYPRYDLLLNPSLQTSKHAEALKGDNEKLIIWLPTFRNSNNNVLYKENAITDFPVINCREKWVRLNDTCKKYKTKIVIKLHQLQKQYNIDTAELSNIQFIDNSYFNIDCQLYDFIALTDALISDYSSVAIDYLLVDKPIAFCLEDYDVYNETRGFVFENPKQYMPGHHIYNIEDLENFVEDVYNSHDPFKKNRNSTRTIAIYNSNNYCKEIAEAIGL